MRASVQAKEAQRLDAIHSSKWSPAQFAPHALRWLQQNEKTSRLFTSSASDSSKGPDTLEPAAMPRIRPSSFSANPIMSVVKPHLGPLLHGLVLDSSLAFAVVSALDNWKQWSDKGGMRREDLEALMQSGNHGEEDGTETEAISPAAALAMASLVAAVIGSIGDGNSAGGMGPPVEALLSHDLRECLKMWPKVRLG